MNAVMPNTDGLWHYTTILSVPSKGNFPTFSMQFRKKKKLS